MLTSNSRGRWLLGIRLLSSAVIAASWPANVLADPGEKKPVAKRSLDEELLDDLSAEPTPELPAEKTPGPKTKDARPSRPSSDSTKPRAAAPGDDLDDALLKGLDDGGLNDGGLDDGEDVSLSGRPGADDPVARLNERMREVQRRIARAQSGEKTQRLEQEISAELAKLIEQIERQARKSAQASSSSSGSSRSQAKQPGESAKPGAQSSDKPARESSERLRKDKTAQVDAEYQELLKDVWGHLPPHLRQQMEQSANEEFLPKYEWEISEYFRALNQRGKRP